MTDVQGRRDADPDQHQPVAGAAGPATSRTRRRHRTAPTIAATDDRACRSGRRLTIANTAAALAPRLTPMMSGLASGLRSVVWKIAPADAERDADQHAEHGARQLALHQDVRRPGIVGAEQDPEEVGDR